MKIEINIGKRHFWAMVGIIIVLFGATIVIAKTPWTNDKPFHETLYADVIAGKSADKVTVDDNLQVNGVLYTDTIAGKMEDKVVVDDSLQVNGDFRFSGMVIGGCQDWCTKGSDVFISCGNVWGKGKCGSSLLNGENLRSVGWCDNTAGSSCGCDEGHKVVIGQSQCWTPKFGFDSMCYLSICVWP